MDKKQQEEQKKALEALKSKAVTPEIAKSIAEKQKHVTKPFNK